MQGLSGLFLKYPEHPHWACSHDRPLVEKLHSPRLAAGGQMEHLKASQAPQDADTQVVESSCHCLCSYSAQCSYLAHLLLRLNLAETQKMENKTKETEGQNTEFSLWGLQEGEKNLTTCLGCKRSQFYTVHMFYKCIWLKYLLLTSSIS